MRLAAARGHRHGPGDDIGAVHRLHRGRSKGAVGSTRVMEKSHSEA